MNDPTTRELQASYDRVAEEYVRRIFDELKDKPLDRQLLDQFADRTRGRGPVCDLGCGPGHVARYLRERGADVIGVDLSPAMVAQARRLNPDIEFRAGDMRALDVEDGAWCGIAAFYSLIHIPPAEIVGVLRELKRVLQPGGDLLLAFHIGDEVLHLEEWWGQNVSVDFHFFRPDQIARDLEVAGFEVEDVIEREPYPDVEHQSRRAYLLATKPSGERAGGPRREAPRLDSSVTTNP
jgi:SAM-dependent methyltransferase